MYTVCVWLPGLTCLVVVERSVWMSRGASEHRDVQALFDDPAAVGTMVPIGDCTSTETKYWAVEVVRPHAGADVAPLLPGGTWTSARALAGVGFKDVGLIAKFDAAMGGKAVALLNWERDTKYCGRSGELMEGSGEGWRSSPYVHRWPCTMPRLRSAQDYHALPQHVTDSTFTCAPFLLLFQRGCPAVPTD
jgi:NADH pyrophosphatase NudC (nudix superfamily)